MKIPTSLNCTGSIRLTHQKIGTEPTNKDLPIFFGFGNLHVLKRIEIVGKNGTLALIHVDQSFL